MQILYLSGWLLSLLYQQAYAVLSFRGVPSTYPVPGPYPPKPAAPPNEVRLAAGGSRTWGEGTWSERVRSHGHGYRDRPPSDYGGRTAPATDFASGPADRARIWRPGRGRRRRWRSGHDGRHGSNRTRRRSNGT